MKRLIATSVIVICTAFCGRTAEPPHDVLYVTWPPVEPDKCVAAWIIKSYVQTNASFHFIERGTTVTNGIVFDVPGSDYIRDHRLCASEKVVTKHGIKNSQALAAADLARRIEIGFWHAEFTEKERVVVDELRSIQTATNAPEVKLQRAFNLLSRTFKKPRMNTN
ncbi:MAG: chromate resistance protein [Verrucomicrobia bacterium]|nr:chromate resistance protein [Verrucomicrobiota bacterium]